MITFESKTELLFNWNYGKFLKKMKKYQKESLKNKHMFLKIGQINAISPSYEVMIVKYEMPDTLRL